MGSGWALFLGSAGDTELHAHHAVQITVGLEVPVELDVEEGILPPTWAVLVRPDVSHRLLGGGQLLAVLFLEPESALGRSILSSAPASSTAILDEAQARGLRSALPEIARDAGPASDQRLLSLLKSLAPHGPAPATPNDPRVVRTIHWLKTRGGIGTLEEAAQFQSLSASRLGHLFSEEVGIPFRPFALWLRLQGAFGQLAQGANLTQAAHGAGFADSAHLTRTFRRMFGITPSDLARHASIT
jgi:AraC-like DNA-binding protein